MKPSKRGFFYYKSRVFLNYKSRVKVERNFIVEPNEVVGFQMCDHELVNEGDLLLASSAKRFLRKFKVRS